MTRMIVTVCFLVAFAAGFTIGLERKRVVEPPKDRPAHKSGTWLTCELNLTSEQQAQLHQIWRDTAWQGGQKREETRRQIRSDRDQAIENLIPAGDKDKYKAIQADYLKKTADLDQEWRASFQASVEQTKKILTPEQRDKYEKLLQRGRFGHGQGPGGWHRGDHERDHDRNRMHEQPSTSPSA